MRLLALAVPGLLLLLACQPPGPVGPGPRVALTPPRALCAASPPGPGGFCLPVRLLERSLRRVPLRLLHLRQGIGGTSGAAKMRLSFTDPRRPGRRWVVDAKWKEAPRFSAEGLNNSPRREVAAYAIQALFLEPDRFVVPPTAVRCLPLIAYRRHRPRARPTFRGGRCVLGVLAYWLQGVTGRRVYSRIRWRRDPIYRGHLADFNLFSYLVEHRDSRSANWLRARDPRHPRVFSVDNGLSFGAPLLNPIAWFSRDWRRIFVPALRRRAVDRLRVLDRRALRARLGAVAQFRHTPRGWIPAPRTLPMRDDRGVRKSATTLQLGLTEPELAALDRRIRRLIHLVDHDEIPVF